VNYLVKENEVLLLSTHPFRKTIGGVRIECLPKWLSAGDSITRGKMETGGRQSSILAKITSASLLRTPFVWHLWQRLNLVEVLSQGKAARKRVAGFSALTDWHPRIISAMGNDFVYIAAHSPLHRMLTKRTVKGCDGFMADCLRDLRLAIEFGLRESAPRGFFPGNGGVDMEVFTPGIGQEERQQKILYFRGISPLFRPRTLMRAVAKLTADSQHSEVILHVLAPRSSLVWFEREGSKNGLTRNNFIIEEFLPTDELVRLLQTVAIVVSPTISDGTPNSMLEGMACGAFPVVSNLESIREWITPMRNGILFDPEDADELAASLALALRDLPLRKEAQVFNYGMIRERADYSKVMPAVNAFYRKFAPK
jgi:glycosyltransferase involved in cell wall biosynthesis